MNQIPPTDTHSPTARGTMTFYTNIFTIIKWAVYGARYTYIYMQNYIESQKLECHKDACESFICESLISESFLQPVHVNLNKLLHSNESDFPYDREFVNQCSILSRYTAAYYKMS